jgi:hypothetical protein
MNDLLNYINHGMTDLEFTQMLVIMFLLVAFTD